MTGATAPVIFYDFLQARFRWHLEYIGAARTASGADGSGFDNPFADGVSYQLRAGM